MLSISAHQRPSTNPSPCPTPPQSPLTLLIPPHKQSLVFLAYLAATLGSHISPLPKHPNTPNLPPALPNLCSQSANLGSPPPKHHTTTTLFLPLLLFSLFFPLLTSFLFYHHLLTCWVTQRPLLVLQLPSSVKKIHCPFSITLLCITHVSGLTQISTIDRYCPTGSIPAAPFTRIIDPSLEKITITCTASSVKQKIASRSKFTQ